MTKTQFNVIVALLGFILGLVLGFLFLSGCSDQDEDLASHLRNDEGAFIHSVQTINQDDLVPRIKIKVVNDSPIQQKITTTCNFRFADERTLIDSQYSNMDSYRWKYFYLTPGRASKFQVRTVCFISSKAL